MMITNMEMNMEKKMAAARNRLSQKRGKLRAMMKTWPRQDCQRRSGDISRNTLN